MIKREAAFTLLFRHWLKANPRPSAVFELKQCGSSLPFSAVQPHQIDALLAAKGTGLLYKAPDDSMGVKPCDLLYLHGSEAYVVIKYGSRCFVLIDIDVFVHESQVSPRRSLTMIRAQEICTVMVLL